MAPGSPIRRSPTWLIDELRHAGRENLDPEHVERYDEKEDAGAAAEVALLEAHGLGPESVVVELGPGTGQFTVEIAPRCGRVVAVDVSPPMLDRLERKLAEHRIENVELVRAGFLGYEHSGQKADFVYSRLALHHLPDFWKVLALANMRRILRSGGILRIADVVYGFEPTEAEERLEAWCAAYPGDAADGEWRRSDVEEHIRDEHSTFTWLFETMTERTGFEIATAERSEDGIFARYVLRAI